MKVSFTILLGMAISLIGFGQVPYFKSIEVTTLPIGEVNVMTSDNNGVLWLASNSAIYNYDGSKFKKAATISCTVTCITTLTNNCLVIGSNSGLMLTFKILGRELQFVDSLLLQNKITNVIGLATDKWLVCTYGGGCQLVAGNKVLQNINEKNGLIDNYVNNALMVGQKAYIATDNGMSVYEVIKSSSGETHLNYHSNLMDNQELFSLVNTHDEVSIFTKHIEMYNLQCAENLLSGNTLAPNMLGTSMKQFANSNATAWALLTNNTLAKIDLLTKKINAIYGTENGLDLSDVKTMYCDKQGVLWLCHSSGLMYCSNSSIEIMHNMPGVSLSNITSLAMQNDTIIFYTNNDGLHKINLLQGADGMEKINARVSLKGQQVVCMHIDPMERLWIGTFNDILYCINLKDFSIKKFTKANGLINASSISISDDGQRLWFATLGGIYTMVLDDKKAKFTYEASLSKLAGTYTYKITPDKNGNVWLATDGNGLIKSHNGNHIRYDENTLPGLKIIYSIATDNMGNVWCGTAGNGLLKFDGQKFTSVAHIALAGKTIHTVEPCGKYMIAATDNAIVAVNQATGLSTVFDSEQGIYDLRHATNISANHHDIACFGINNGIVRMNSAEINESKLLPLVLHKMGANDHRIDTYAAQLEHDENDITFEYAALHFEHPQDVYYKYRLKGNNGEWVETRDNFLSFSNLVPGDYELQLQAYLVNNDITSEKLKIPFTIKKPLYATTPFIILATFSSALVLFAIVRWRVKSIRKLESLKKEKLLFELNSLKMQVNPHFLHNSFNTLIHIIENDNDKAIEYVEQLSDFFRELLQVKDKDLITLAEEIKLATHYFFLQQQRFGKMVTMQTKITTQQLHKQLPPLTLQIALENIFKHNTISHSNQVMIKIIANDEYLTIHNNVNPKMYNAESTGLGIANIKSRYSFFTQKEVTINTANGSFEMSVPLI